MTSSKSDKELIDLIVSGEQQHFSVLVSRYQSMVFTIAFRFTRNREDAEELAQSAFVKAYRNLADFRSEAKFSTWLYTIISSLCLSFVRKKKHEILSLSNEKIQIAADEIDGGFSANHIERKSKATMLQQAIAKLSSDDAQVLTLFYLGEQTLEEMGSILGITPNSAKVKLHRARIRLKKMIETRFTEDFIHLQNR